MDVGDSPTLGAVQPPGGVLDELPMAFQGASCGRRRDLDDEHLVDDELDLGMRRLGGARTPRCVGHWRALDRTAQLAHTTLATM